MRGRMGGFAFSAPALVGELPGGCGGLWGWVVAEPPASLCLGPQRRSGRLRDIWGLVLGTGEGLWGLGKCLALGEDPWLQRVPEFLWGPFLFLQGSSFAGDQPGPGFLGDSVAKELAPRLSEPGRADGLCHQRRVQQSHWWPRLGGQGWVASTGCTLSPCPWPPEDGDRGDKVLDHHFPLSTFKSPGPGFCWEH